MADLTNSGGRDIIPVMLCCVFGTPKTVLLLANLEKVGFGVEGSAGQFLTIIGRNEKGH